MLVIEGPDGAGKSTLVRHLCDRFGLQVGQRGVANRDELYKVTRQDTYWALSAAVLGQEVLVWDRLFISEFVYADLVGRPCEFQGYETLFIQRIMEALQHPMIICLPPYEVVQRNVAEAHQMKGVKENLEDIYRAYRSASLPWGGDLMLYDYTGTTDLKKWGGPRTLEEIEGRVAKYLEERKGRQAWDSHLTGIH